MYSSPTNEATNETVRAALEKTDEYSNCSLHLAPRCCELLLEWDAEVNGVLRRHRPLPDKRCR